jgi:hypothetical protein
MTLTPKVVDSGWAKRWTRQSFDLFLRAPSLFIGIIMLFMAVAILVPQPFWLAIPLSVFMVSVLFCALRAADKFSGDAWLTTWTFFKQSVRDLAYLSRDIFVVFGIILLIFLALFYTMHALYDAMAASSSVIHHAASITKPHAVLPQWLRNAILKADGLMLFGIFLPGSLQLIFLTMSVGHNTAIHYDLGIKAARMNGAITVFFWISGGAICLVFTGHLLKEIQSLDLGYAILVALSIGFWFFGTWGYLWCREMFEGSSENAKKVSKSVVQNVALSSS